MVESKMDIQIVPFGLEFAKAKKVAERVDETKFKNYFEFSTPVANVKPHQALAINRGERLKVLSVKVVFLMIVPF